MEIAAKKSADNRVRAALNVGTPAVPIRLSARLVNDQRNGATGTIRLGRGVGDRCPRAKGEGENGWATTSRAMKK